MELQEKQKLLLVSSSPMGCGSIQRAYSCDLCSLCVSHECHCPLEAAVTLNPGFGSMHKIKSARLEIVPCLNLLSAVRIGCSLVKWEGTVFSLLDVDRQCAQATPKLMAVL